MISNFSLFFSCWQAICSYYILVGGL